MSIFAFGYLITLLAEVFYLTASFSCLFMADFTVVVFWKTESEKTTKKKRQDETSASRVLSHMSHTEETLFASS